MRPEYKDWKAAKKNVHRDHAKAAIPSLDFLAQASVSAEHLTGYHEWNTYLSYVQAVIEKARIYLGECDARLTNPDIVNHDQLIQIKIQRESIASMIRAWEAAISLPKEIIEKGEEAKNHLLELVGSEEDEAAT